MSEVNELEEQRKMAEELIARRDAALRLRQNRDFQKIILDEYLVTEAARLVQQSSDPVLTVQQRADALSMAQATGHLKRYLSMCVTMANVAERDLEELEQAFIEAQQEEELEAQERAAGISIANGDGE